MKNLCFKKGESFLAVFVRQKRRVQALILVFAMVLSIFAPNLGSLGVVHADGEKDVTGEAYGLSVSVLVNGNVPDNPDIVYEGDTLGLTLKFTIPASDLNNGKIYVYDIPDNIVYTGSSTTGDISIPKNSSLYSETQTAGTYTIDKENGKVYFDVSNQKIFDYNTGTGSDQGKNPMPVPIEFFCQAEATLDGSDNGTKYDIPGYSGNLFIADNDMGMSVTKEKVSGPDADGIINFKVTVEVPSNKSSSYSTINITDTFMKRDNNKDILSYVDNSLSISKVSGGNTSSVNVYSFDLQEDVISSAKSNGVFHINELQQLKSGEKYEITYQLHSDLVAGDKIAFNDAKAESSLTVTNGTETKTITDIQNQQIDIPLSKNLVSKKGELDDTNNCINYIITFNGGHTDLNGITLRDVIDFPDAEGSLQDIVNRINLTSIEAIAANGSAASNASINSGNFKSLFTDSKESGGISINSADTNKYIIYYTYKPAVSNSASDLAFNNLAYVDEDNQDDGNVGIGAIDPQQKSIAGDVNVLDGKIKLNWNITVENPLNNYGQNENTTIKNSYTVDNFTSNSKDVVPNHKEVKPYINSEITGLPSGITVTYLKADGSFGSFNEAKDSEGKVYGVKFSYKDLAPGEKLDFTYPTYVDFNDMPDYNEICYLNEATYNYSLNGTPKTDFDRGERYYIKPKDVHKYIYADKDNPGKTKTIDNFVYSDTNNKLYYGIVIKYQPGETEKTYAVDKLPAGTTFGEIYKVWPSDSDDDVTVKDDYYAITNLVKSTYSAQDGTVTFAIDPAAFNSEPYGAAGNGVTIIYSVVLPSERPSSAGSDGVYKAFNQVTYKSMQSSVTQPVQYEADAPILSKKWLDDPNEVVTDSEVERTFRVVINPDKKDIDENKDTLTLTDLITMKKNEINSISLKSIHLYEYSATATDNKGASRDASMSYNEDTSLTGENIQYRFTLNIPDEEAYVLEYTYKIDRGNYSEANGVWFQNHVSLAGKYSDSLTKFFQVSSSSASSAVTNPRVTLYKVDSNNYSIKLSGAEFKLEKFVKSGDAYNWQTAVASLNVGKVGTALIGIDNLAQETYDSSINTINLNTKTVYRLTEITPPSGYTLNNEPAYFVLGSGVSLNELTNTIAVKSAVASLPSGSTVNYFVTNSDYNFADEEDLTNHKISIKKKWIDSEGNELSGSQISGNSATVELHRVKAVSSGSNALTLSDDTVIGTYELNKENDFFRNIDVTNLDSDNNPYYYYVVEKSASPAASYTTTYSAVNSAGQIYSDNGVQYSTSDGTLTVSNKSDATVPTTGTIKLKKIFDTVDGIVDDTIRSKKFYVTLKKMNSDGTFEYYDENGASKGDTYTEIEIKYSDVTEINLPYGNYKVEEVVTGSNSAEIDGYLLSVKNPSGIALSETNDSVTANIENTYEEDSSSTTNTTPNPPDDSTTNTTPNPPDDSTTNTTPTPSDDSTTNTTPNPPDDSTTNTTPNPPDDSTTNTTPNVPDDSTTATTPNIPEDNTVTTTTDKTTTVTTTEKKPETKVETPKDSSSTSEEVSKEKKTTTSLTTQKTVKTGDDFGLMLIIIVMISCVVLTTVIVIIKRKVDRDDNNNQDEMV